MSKVVSGSRKLAQFPVYFLIAIAGDFHKIFSFQKIAYVNCIAKNELLAQVLSNQRNNQTVALVIAV